MALMVSSRIVASYTRAHRWALDEDAAQPFFRQAVEAGITFWDTANIYQLGTSEELVGRAVRRYSRREDIVLATKVFGKMHEGPGGQGLSRKAILEQVDASLTLLGTGYIDLYQIHRFDPDTPAEETMDALHACTYTLLTYTNLMAMTTIRVEAEVRDRLAAQARAHGRSLGAELGAMLDEMVWQGIEAGYRRLAASQAEMRAYQAEASEWISADIPDLAVTAADEYPEYNS